ncbi:MAG TPA: M28 family peptidase, partial [Polyangiaceae bacterium]|nr:M28 family peptidase [Polyangiaceae bacterium]
ARAPSRRRIRIAFFSNEEPPFFKQAGMGSYVHAMNARRRGDPIKGMLALETMGFYSHAPHSQRYPWPVGLLYPTRANFIAFVGDVGSRSLVRDAIGAFRELAQFPSEGAALPTTFPGIDWSDHWAFRRAGYPAIMVTDTAPYRDPNYHRPTDSAERLDYRSLARVTRGLEGVVRRLADAP